MVPISPIAMHWHLTDLSNVETLVFDPPFLTDFLNIEILAPQHLLQVPNVETLVPEDCRRSLTDFLNV